MTGVERISKERQRQIEEELWTPEHDNQHVHGEIARAAAIYALSEEQRLTLGDDVLSYLWPWDVQWYKPTPDDRIRELEKAGALIAAEIDRLQRLESQTNEE